jgi:hypothetical protein
LSRRISSAIASRSASRTVMLTISAPAGNSEEDRRSSPGPARWRRGGGGQPLPQGAGAGPEQRPAAPLAAAETSSPSAAITPIGVLTATFSVPSATRILASTPSSTASTSMVALSVSISAMTSPALT